MQQLPSLLSEQEQRFQRAQHRVGGSVIAPLTPRQYASPNVDQINFKHSMNNYQYNPNMISGRNFMVSDANIGGVRRNSASMPSSVNPLLAQPPVLAPMPTMDPYSQFNAQVAYPGYQQQPEEVKLPPIYKSQSAATDLMAQAEQQKVQYLKQQQQALQEQTKQQKAAPFGGLLPSQQPGAFSPRANPGPLMQQRSNSQQLSGSDIQPGEHYKHLDDIYENPFTSIAGVEGGDESSLIHRYDRATEQILQARIKQQRKIASLRAELDRVKDFNENVRNADMLRRHVPANGVDYRGMEDLMLNDGAGIQRANKGPVQQKQLLNDQLLGGKPPLGLGPDAEFHLKQQARIQALNAGIKDVERQVQSAAPKISEIKSSGQNPLGQPPRKAALPTESVEETLDDETEEESQDDYDEFDEMREEALSKFREWGSVIVNETVAAFDEHIDHGHESQSLVDRWARFSIRYKMILHSLNQNKSSVPISVVNLLTEFLSGNLPHTPKFLLPFEIKMWKRMKKQIDEEGYVLDPPKEKPGKNQQFVREKADRAKFIGTFVLIYVTIKLLVANVLNSTVATEALMEDVTKKEKVYFFLYCYTTIAVVTDIIWQIYKVELIQLYGKASELDVKNEVFKDITPGTLQNAKVTYKTFKFGDDQAAEFVKFSNQLKEIGSSVNQKVATALQRIK